MTPAASPWSCERSSMAVAWLLGRRIGAPFSAAPRPLETASPSCGMTASPSGSPAAAPPPPPPRHPAHNPLGRRRSRTAEAFLDASAPVHQHVAAPQRQPSAVPERPLCNSSQFSCTICCCCSSLSCGTARILERLPGAGLRASHFCVHITEPC